MTHTAASTRDRSPLRRASWGAVAGVLVLPLVLASCDGPSRGSRTQPSAASGFLVQVVASPNVVRAAQTADELGGGQALDTGGCAQVQVKVWDTKGDLVDGATVIGTATLGVFRVGTEDLLNFVGTTTRGSLSRTWCAKRERGTAIVTVNVEDATASTQITIF